MLNAVVLDTFSENEISISSILKTAYARRELPIKHLLIVHELQSLLGSADENTKHCNIFIASLHRLTDEYMVFIQALRRENENVFVVFIVDKGTDITCCVRPSLRPAGILFIPLEQHKVYQTINEIYIESLRIARCEKQHIFTIKSGGEYFSISLEDICFFEARGKQIAVKTGSQEILFYSNFETVLGQLPDWFIRCHKGFIVNTKRIVQTNFTDMTLILKDKCIIPVSRTYRDDIRGFLKLKVV